MQTPVQVTFKNLPTSDTLEARIRERVDRLERFYGNITGCRVVVEVPHRSASSGKVPIALSLEVEIPGQFLVSKGEETQHQSKNDSGRVVTQVFDAMERQLEDHVRMRQRDVKQHASTAETGRITRLFRDQHYGFVEVAGGVDLYFTENALSGMGLSEIEEGMMVRVTRASGEGPMGPQASSVARLGDQDKLKA